LIQPGTAAVNALGIITIAGADLDAVHLAERCSLKIDAGKHIIALRHGSDHAVTKVDGYGAVDAFRELRVIGVDPNKINDHPPRVIRRSIDGTRWLELRFAEEVLVQKTLKNKGNLTKPIAPARRA
jgi:hypothetical protein